MNAQLYYKFFFLYQQDYINQGNSFKAANVGLYGLGLQSHFKAYVAPDPTLLKVCTILRSKLMYTLKTYF